MARYPPGTNPWGRPASISWSHRRRANSVGQYSSKPDSPTKVTRIARHGTGPTLSSRACRYGNASVEMSVSVSGCTMARASGPHSATHA